MIKNTIKFTEIFLSTIDFYPTYIYMKKSVNNTSRFKNNLEIFNDYFIDIIYDNNLFSEFQNTMAWDILIGTPKMGETDIFCMYDINLSKIHKKFNKSINDKKNDKYFYRYMKQNNITYIDNYSKEFAKEWKNRKKYYKN